MQLGIQLTEKNTFDRNTAKMNFRETVWAHIERLGLTRNKFYERTLLDDRQFRKFKLGSSQQVTLDTALAVCVGLDLGLEYGEPLLAKAGYTIANFESNAYQILLTRCRGWDIPACNEFLKTQNVPLIRIKECQALVEL